MRVRRLCVRTTFILNDLSLRYLARWFILALSTSLEIKSQGHRLKFTATWWKMPLFCYEHTLRHVCRVLCAKVVGATSSEDFLVFLIRCSRVRCSCQYVVVSAIWRIKHLWWERSKTWSYSPSYLLKRSAAHPNKSLRTNQFQPSRENLLCDLLR